MELNQLLEELFQLLDKNEDLIELEKIKKSISPSSLELINNYRLNPTIENKKLIYENKELNEYLKREMNVNYLIMEINKKFKRSRNCESNKW